MRYVVLIGRDADEAVGPFTSRESAERIADAIRHEGTVATIVGLISGRDALEFYGVKS